VKPACLISGLGLFFANLAWADYPPPPADFAVSQDKTKIVRLSYENPKDHKSRALLSVYGFDAKKNAYLPVKTIRTDREDLGQFMFVSDDGRFVIVANISLNPGLRLFDGGTLRKAWPLGELITGLEAEAAIRTQATLQWFEQGGFFGSEFRFTGPILSERVSSESAPLKTGINESARFSFTLEPATLTLRKAKPQAR
jgi:hypothetical protein